jgi:hypothetical protein
MAYATFITVDNSGEDPEEGRRGLREELVPAMKALTGFQSAMFMTAYERGRGVGVVVFETLEQAESLAEVVEIGSTIHPGVTVTGSEVLEVSATA